LRRRQGVFTLREDFFQQYRSTIVKISVGIILGQKEEPGGFLTSESASYSVDQ
jgi:hypothetical protein